MTSREEINRQIEGLNNRLNIKIAPTKRDKFNDGIFNIIQDMYLELSKKLHKEINPSRYKEEEK